MTDKQAIKQELADRVEAAIADNYKTKRNTEKKKTCTMCDKSFIGRADQATCSDSCRKAKSRA
jgi:hypothetical protein